MLLYKRIPFAFLLLALQKLTFGQQTYPNTIPATFITEKISLDGKLNEPAWQMAPSIDNFTQRELDFGKPSTEKTKVAVLYNRLALYVGIWCFQNGIKHVHAKYMQRDFLYDEDDNFQIAISPFADKRNGYLFIINPNGARADLLISGHEDANKDWNGIWDAQTSITDEGWFAEIRIPFNSFQFKNDSSKSWSINFERNIRYKNEQVSWQGWTRDCSIYCLVNAGTLSGLKNIGYAKRFELKPFLLGAFEKKKDDAVKWPNKIGADLNVNLTPTLKMNFTANTDFAQVEADRIAVNLTRFNLFYPEKREFFLEGYQNYQFSLGDDKELFYTRKIGIENFQSVSIIAGARVFGKMGPNNIGLLNIETEKVDSVPRTNNTVIRYKRDIGSQSYIGAIITSKNNSNISNQVAGLDGAFSTSHFHKNKNLVIAALISKSFDKNQLPEGTYAWRFYIDYPNDILDNFIGASSIQQNYNPEMGFLNRKNYNSFTWNLRYYPRWFTRYGIRRMAFKPWQLTLYKTYTTGELESLYNESRPFGFFTKKGESFEYDLQQQFERLDNSFQLTDSIIIPPGKYWMQRQQIIVSTYSGRKIWAIIIYNWGKFYDGKISTWQGNLGINASKHLNFQTDYTFNNINFPGQRLATKELAEAINYAFNPRLDIATFIQWNSLDDLLSGNFRLHWIPRIGSDLYLVYNRVYDKLEHLKISEPEVSSGAAKLVWRFTF